MNTSMLLLGADVSGNLTGDGQSRHIGLVLGTEENVNRMYRNLGLSKKIHMVAMSKLQRKTVFQNLEFNDKLLGLCLNVEKQKTISSIINDPKFNPLTTPKSRLQKHFDYLVLKSIRPIIAPFLVSHGCEISDVIMQCDSDMVKTGRNWQMETSDRGRAYEIADVVAWFNGHSNPIKSCQEINLVYELLMQMRLDFLK